MPAADRNAAAFRAAFARAGNTRAEVYELANGNHSLMEARTGYMSEGPRLKAFVPGYLDRVAGWVRAQTGVDR